MWILIDKELDEHKRFKKVLPCGSIKALEKEKIIEKGSPLTYTQLYDRLVRFSPDRVWQNERYFIRFCKLVTSKKSKKI